MPCCPTPPSWSSILLCEGFRLSTVKFLPSKPSVPVPRANAALRWAALCCAVHAGAVRAEEHARPCRRIGEQGAGGRASAATVSLRHLGSQGWGGLEEGGGGR